MGQSLIQGDSFAGIHAGPCRETPTIDEIKSINTTNADDYLLEQFLWNRFNHGDESGYTENHVANFMQGISLPNGHLFVAHSPDLIGKFGWHKTISPKHHVIFAAHDNYGYASITNDALTFVTTIPSFFAR